MKKFLMASMLVVGLSFALGAVDAAPEVSSKQDVAIFAIGYAGWSVPRNALADIDVKLQKVFLDLKRFTVLGMTQRFTKGDIDSFISSISKMKKDGTKVPDAFRFGETVMTQADFDRMANAFTIAIPLVTGFTTESAKGGGYNAELKVAITFIDPQQGTLIGVADITSTGYDTDSSTKAEQSAIDGLSDHVQYEIRKIEQFQNHTRVLAVNGGEVKLELGSNMGVKLGDEYAVRQTTTADGITETKDMGLVVVTDVSSQSSTGSVLFSDIPMEKNLSLLEIARLGVEFEGFAGYLVGGGLSTTLAGDKTSGGDLMVGLTSTYVRGMGPLRPFVTIEVPLTGIRTFDFGFYNLTFLPVNVLVGSGFNFFLGRLAVQPSVAVGASYISVSDSNGNVFPGTSPLAHVGGKASGKLSYLITRDIKAWCEVGLEEWLSLSTLYNSYGGLIINVGGSYKL